MVQERCRCFFPPFQDELLSKPCVSPVASKQEVFAQPIFGSETLGKEDKDQTFLEKTTQVSELGFLELSVFRVSLFYVVRCQFVHLRTLEKIVFLESRIKLAIETVVSCADLFYFESFFALVMLLAVYLGSNPGSYLRPRNPVHLEKTEYSYQV